MLAWNFSLDEELNESLQAQFIFVQFHFGRVFFFLGLAVCYVIAISQFNFKHVKNNKSVRHTKPLEALMQWLHTSSTV